MKRLNVSVNSWWCWVGLVLLTCSFVGSAGADGASPVRVNARDAGAVTRATLQHAIDATAARGESLEAIRAAELAFVLGEAKRRFGKPATVIAGSATYAAAERAAREHPEFVGRLIRAQGEKTALP